MSFKTGEVIFDGRLRVEEMEETSHETGIVEAQLKVVFEILDAIPKIGMTIWLHDEFLSRDWNVKSAIQNEDGKLVMTAQRFRK